MKLIFFLFIYIVHAIVVMWMIQYFLTEFLLSICICIFEWTEGVIILLMEMYEWVSGDHLILQHLLILPKEYVEWYLYPLMFVKESSRIGVSLIKFENAYVLTIMTVLACLLVDNLRSFQKLRKLSLHLDNFEETCPICLEDLITPNEEAERIRCGHFFHNSCLSKWIMRSKEITKHLSYNYSCPICRHPLH